MADYVIGSPALFNQDAQFFKDVYIYGTLYYQFESKTKEIFSDIEVNGTATFNGPVVFNDSVEIGDVLIVKDLTVTDRFNVLGNSLFSGISTFNDNVVTNEDLFAKRLNVSEYFGVGINSTVISASGLSGNVGINSVFPEQKLDVSGSVKIDEFIYDSVNSPGFSGSFLNRDENGIRWVTFEPAFSEGIFIQDEGSYIPIVGAAQSFSILNFKQINSLGLGTDTIIPIPSPSSPTLIADIQSKDLWGFTAGGNIYRMTSVGIQNNNPTSTLDITGTLHATGAVDFDSTLNVDGTSTLVGQVTVNTGIVPDTDEGAYLGSAALPFSESHIGEIRIANSTNNNKIDTVTGDLILDSATNNVNIQADLDVDGTLNVDGAATLQTTLNVKGATDLDTTLNVDGAATLQTTLNVKGATDLDTTLNVDGATTLQTTLNVKGATDLDTTLNVDGATTLQTTLNVKGSTDLDSTLNVDGTSVFQNTVELNSSLIDVNNSTATGKFDYRLSSVGTGVSWRPPGVQTQNAIWVTMDGNDSNTGYLEGDAKRTVGAAASIAQEGDTIFVRSGVYYENNPIGLRTDVSVSGQDLRLVTIVPTNVTKDVFHVRRGCLIENLNFAGSNVSVAHTGCGAVAFPPTNPLDYAVSGFIAPGPANEGSSGRWRSPYIRNCTNFMTKSIGMKVDGNNATASSIGADLKSMVCDSFTQYNEAGIGVSITNNGYAQLVSIFTINCDIGIYADSGGSCDLTNSNSSFGNFGLVAVGLGATEFTGKVLGDSLPEVDTITLTSVFDQLNLPRRPYDGQSLWFKINLNNYPDAVGSGVITEPLRELGSIQVLNGGSGFSVTSPPNIIIRDADGTVQPKGPQGIIAEVSPTINDAGQITAIDVVSTGRNYLASQNIVVDIEGNTGLATAIMSPIYFTVSAATPPTDPTGITTVTFNEFIPYEVFNNDDIELRRISRILTSSHSFEYIGTGTDINTATPLKGAVPIKANEVVARDGAQIPFTSTDQKGNFDIGEGIQIDQTTSSIRGRDFSRAIQAEVTPLILALR
jgi:cytoskeletal protein CcmA (bactofilin family)